jgi:CO dehydrogenase maturation factor
MVKQMVAVCGKGGSGKTALVALMTKHLLLLEENPKLLVIDADPTMNLSLVLGVSPRKTVNDIREEIIEEARKAGKTGKEDLARSLDYRLFEALVEAKRFSFLVMGRPESLGCYCPVNDFLRSGIELLAENYDVVIIDGEAGVEQINRQVMKTVDSIIIVSDVSSRGLQTAAILKKVITSHEKIFNFKKLGLILNRVKGGQLPPNLQKSSFDLLGVIPEDPLIAQFDLEGQSLLDLPDDSKAFRAIKDTWSHVFMRSLTS